MGLEPVFQQSLSQYLKLEYITKFLRTPFRPDAKVLNNEKICPGRPDSAENFVMYSSFKRAGVLLVVCALKREFL